MSADNWDLCPRCLLEPNPYYERPVSTLREDYELGITTGGEFYVIYKGRCTQCGFGKEFRHTEQLKVQP